MGLFDFVKEAGERILSRGAAGVADQSEESPSDLEMMNALNQMAGEFDLTPHLGGIVFEAGTATVTGRMNSQAEREKLILLVGNTRGVARVDDQLTVESPEPEATMYAVQSGDTLSKIAKRHYGDAMKYPAIFEANRPMLKDPDRIYPGQVLRIPPIS